MSQEEKPVDLELGMRVLPNPLTPVLKETHRYVGLVESDACKLRSEMMVAKDFVSGAAEYRIAEWLLDLK